MITQGTLIADKPVNYQTPPDVAPEGGGVQVVGNNNINL